MGADEVPFEAVSVEIGVEWGDIQEAQTLEIEGSAVDAVAVGHYLGVQPQAAELALDRAVSVALAEATPGRPAPLLLSEFSKRGILRGELAQLFVLPEAGLLAGRQSGSRRQPAPLVVVAGMGEPGRFGSPELTVLARELCWYLGRLRRRHLATVLIGAGQGNLSVADAVSAWIRGYKLAVTGAVEDEQLHLPRLTFVERDPRRLQPIRTAILTAKHELERRSRLFVHYRGMSAEEFESPEVKKAAEQFSRDDFERYQARHTRSEDEAPPTRITLELDGDVYRFAAITEFASVPEREVPLDPVLVMQANDELVAERDPALQLEKAQFLQRLLVPDEVRRHFFTPAPIVMLIDATTARIHWEVMAQSDLDEPSGDNLEGGAVPAEVDVQRYYLGTSRGFTRQLRTSFAPLPDPPPPPRRLLRVLVVADPAADAELPGARAEGEAVAELLEAFNTTWASGENRVSVERLIGPEKATRTEVLRRLMLHSYDVLHFAGHCFFDPADPRTCGWVFTGGKTLSAKELTRVDRIPAFVFSNACESGVTPDRSERQSSSLAPSFAESFFARGVANFVCTAWPVDDNAAVAFARRLYASLLGVELPEPGGSGYTAGEPQPMYVAMRHARLEIASAPGGIRIWGAYQHYGDPHLRFLDPARVKT